MKWVRSDGCKIPIKSWCQDVEESAMEQVIRLANHPAIVMHVALMPDCHAGMGMPIGGVIACDNAIIVNAVGVDIGCGVVSAKTDMYVDDVTVDDVKLVLK